MDRRELQKIVVDYLMVIPKHHFSKKREMYYAHYTEQQWNAMTASLRNFTSHGKEDEVILLFVYLWNNQQKNNPSLNIKDMTELLWENGFKNSLLSKNELKKMCLTWSLLEQQTLDFSKENQKVLMDTPKKILNRDIEYEK